MNDYIKNFMHLHPIKTQRGLEIISGIVPYLIIAFVVIGSVYIPETVAYFIIAFNIYWLYRSVQLAINAITGYLNLKATSETDWSKKLQENPQLRVRAEKICHMVVVVNVKEPIDILERNIDSLRKQNFPHQRMVVVLAMEARIGKEAHLRAEYIKKKYKNSFLKIIDSYHELAPGETIGKHSNNTHATRAAKEIMTQRLGIDLENIVVTTADIDAVFPEQYFSLLTYKFLTVDKPQNKFYQAPLLMYNNINRLPFLVRLPNIMGSIFYLSTLRKASGRFMNYSTYSTPLAMLDKVGYWDIDVIPEDWHINLKSYFALKGDVAIVPLYVPVFLDAAESTTRWKTFVSNYEQIKRWAWGVVDVPYVVKKFFEHPEISLWDKFVKLSLTLEWHFIWSSSWFLITLGATVPTIINPVFGRTALGYNLSKISSTILTICLVGLITIIIVDILLNPHKKNKFLAFIHPLTYLQWIFLPVFGLIFGSLPGLESQTRLMLGKHIDYKVTEKVGK